MKLLVCLDFSTNSDALWHYAQQLAHALSASVCLLHVTDSQEEVLGYGGVFGEFPLYIDPKELRQEIAQRFRNEHKKMQDYSQQMRDTGISCLGLLVNGGAAVVTTILAEAHKHQSDMILVGSTHKGLLMTMVEGSTSKSLINQANKPVLVVPLKP